MMAKRTARLLANERQNSGPFGSSFRYNPPMNATQAIAGLRARADALKARGATSLFLFGSVARGDETSASDLDLFLDYDPGKKFSLIDLVGIKHFLEDELGVEIDVTTRDSLHPALRAEIERTARRVY